MNPRQPFASIIRRFSRIATRLRSPLAAAALFVGLGFSVASGQVGVPVTGGSGFGSGGFGNDGFGGGGFNEPAGFPQTAGGAENTAGVPGTNLGNSAEAAQQAFSQVQRGKITGQTQNTGAGFSPLSIGQQGSPLSGVGGSGGISGGGFGGLGGFGGFGAFGNLGGVRPGAGGTATVRPLRTRLRSAVVLPGGVVTSFGNVATPGGLSPVSTPFANNLAVTPLGRTVAAPTVSYPPVPTRSVVAGRPVINAAPMAAAPMAAAPITAASTTARGAVVLRGSAATSRSARMAEMMLRLEPGVRSVRNEMAVPVGR